MRGNLFFIAAAALSGFAAGAQSVDAKYPMQWRAESCNGEAILFEGVLHYHYEYIDNNNGTFTYNESQNLSGMKGRGERSGIRYKLSDNYHFSSTYDISLVGNQSGGGQTYTRVVSQGPSRNLRIKLSYTYSCLSFQCTYHFKFDNNCIEG